MRVTLLAFGSRGDTQPFLALADEFARRGHRPRLGVPPNLVDFATAAGFAAEPVGVNVQEFHESAEGRHFLASGNVWAVVRRASRLIRELSAETDRICQHLCNDADLMVASAIREDACSSLAEANKIPFASLYYAPLPATSAFPNPLVTTRQFPGALNRGTSRLLEQLWWISTRSDTHRLRGELGLPPTRQRAQVRMRAAGTPFLQAYSPRIVPDVTDYGSEAPIVGFLRPSAQLRIRLGESGLDPDLRSWLDAGNPPVYFGFGSMPVLDTRATLAMIRAVVARRGLRAIVGAGWSRYDHVDDEQVRLVGMVDHDSLLPRCLAAVHHGGAGTTAAALYAGIPAVVCSISYDQPFWGARLERLGVGAHLRFRDVDADTLGGALDRVLQPTPRERARRLGELLHGDGDAAMRTVDLLERHVDR